MSNYFSTNLKFLRKNRNLSQNKLAEAVGVNQTTIARWEKEEINPSIDNVEEIANILDVPLPDLLIKDFRTGEMSDEEEQEWYNNLKNKNVKLVFDKLHEKKNLTHEQATYINKIIDAIVDEEDNNQ